MVEPDVVARVIVGAVTSRRPRCRYTAGPGARLFAVLAHLPGSLRERLVLRALGLSAVPAQPEAPVPAA